jgi:hypothetical protein
MTNEKSFYITCRESGSVLESKNTYAEAVDLIDEYEQEDINNGDWVANFYAIESMREYTYPQFELQD